MSALAALGVLSLMLMPDEHLHLEHSHDGHHAPLIHRHYEPHHAAAAHPDSIEHDDDDDQPVWLDASFVIPAIDAVPTPLHGLAAGEIPPVVSPDREHDMAIAVAHPSIHAPPLKTPPGLRAPPPPSAPI